MDNAAYAGSQPALRRRRNNRLTFGIRGGLLCRCQIRQRLQADRIMSGLTLRRMEMHSHHAICSRADRGCCAQFSYTHRDNATEVINVFTNK